MCPFNTTAQDFDDRIGQPALAHPSRGHGGPSHRGRLRGVRVRVARGPWRALALPCARARARGVRVRVRRYILFALLCFLPVVIATASAERL